MTFNDLFPSLNAGGAAGASGGQVPVGGLVMLPDHFGEQVEQNGAVYSRSGYLVTDPTKFDTTVFKTPHIPMGQTVSIITGIGRPINQIVDGVWWRIYTSGGSSGNIIQRSTDGIAFTNVTIANPSTNGYAGLLKIDGLWLLCGNWAGGGVSYYWTSPDGVTWTRRSSPWSQIYGASNTNYPNGAPVVPLFTFRGRIYVRTHRTGGFGSDEIYSTTDGVAWRKEVVPDTTFSNAAATQTWVDGTRIAAISVYTDSALAGGVDEYRIFFTTDGVTWQQAQWPNNGTPSGHTVGWVNGKFEFFGRSGPSSNAQGGVPTIYRTTDFTSWTSEPLPYDTDFFPGSKSWMISENQTISVQETLSYVAGWYWLSSTFDAGTIYMSKTGRNWIKRRIHSGSNSFHPCLPTALGNKLLFNDATGSIGPNINVLVDFDQSVISAGAGVRYSEGSFVQYMRIK